MENLTLTTEMIWVMAILAFTIYLFVSEVVRVDVAAVVIMVLLGLTTVIPDAVVPSLVDAKHLFDGFASNAVISIIAVMIIGAGLDKTGVMGKVANFIMKIGGSTEQRIIPLISSTVGFISSFMQNVGAAALFLPVVSRISNRTGLPMSRLLMPMGFCAILGGTITMIGSSPLILLNDLILTSNKSLTAQGMEAMQTFDLFAVTPIGLALVATGIIYFVLAGRFVLPVNKTEGGEGISTMEYFRSQYGLSGDIFEVCLAAGSPLADKTVEELEAAFGHDVSIIALRIGDDARISPSRDVAVPANAVLALMGSNEAIQRQADAYKLDRTGGMNNFADVLTSSRAGISEIVIPPNSRLIGKSLKEQRLRKTYGLNVLAVYRGTEVIKENLRDVVLQSGDTLLQHSSWDDLAAVEKNRRDFLVITTDYPHEELRPHKVHFALVFFVIALSMILFTDVRLSIALLTGAMGMILTGVLTIDEAYGAVSWKTVFLLASLIPLGQAVETSGTANWIAVQTLTLLGGDVNHVLLQAVIAVLATFFTLVMSNVGATVLLVPLAVNIAVQAGADPAVFALTVAIATSNSFFLPTHQVNALIMGPAGYRVIDFMRAGGIMTVLFLIVSLTMLNIVF
ncbi:MAG: SLC13 family permease [Gammaproteobacteria bacterium HGW-Gammaproteobacteria-1]|nr:MAG: SLC13 family permease [Gammaproteobacteria bacterium HGW-Gammaproteobacteria-1]